MLDLTPPRHVSTLPRVIARFRRGCGLVRIRNGSTANKGEPETPGSPWDAPYVAGSNAVASILLPD
jgi:hypothetical protein